MADKDGAGEGTLISRDRVLMAWTFGALLLVGGAVGWAILAFGDPIDREDAVVAVVAGASTLLGVGAIALRRRLPLWAFKLAIPVGTALVTVAATASSSGGEAAYGLFYVWVAMLAGLLLRMPLALLQVLFAVICFGIVLEDRDADFAFNYLLSMAVVLGVAAATLSLLRGRLEALTMRLAEQARLDPLTGLANRRVFDQRLELESERSMRSGEPLSVAICDLDHFKLVNDRLGHEGGDEALKRAAAAIARSVRTVDEVTRLGGEEFGVILPGTASEQAAKVLERIRATVREEFAADAVPLTVSSGIASSARGDGLSLVRAADIAMYEAKAHGKDRTVVHGEAGAADRGGAPV